MPSFFEMDVEWDSGYGEMDIIDHDPRRIESEKNYDLKYCHKIIANNGKIVSSKIMPRLDNDYWSKEKTYKEKKFNKFTSLMEFKDLVKWIPDKSLADACKDFDIGKDSKTDFDILAFNKFIIANNYNPEANYLVEWQRVLEFLKPKKKEGALDNRKCGRMDKNKRLFQGW